MQDFAGKKRKSRLKRAPKSDLKSRRRVRNALAMSAIFTLF
jgi:hypothetical protein